MVKGKTASGKERDEISRKRQSPLDRIRELSLTALDHSEAAIEERRQLTARFLEEIEKEIQEALRMLHMLGDPWKHGDWVVKEPMRISLDKALTARKKERRDRLLQAWKDLKDLEEARVQLQKEEAALGETRAKSRGGGKASYG